MGVDHAVTNYTSYNITDGNYSTFKTQPGTALPIPGSATKKWYETKNDMKTAYRIVHHVPLHHSTYVPCSKISEIIVSSPSIEKSDTLVKS